MKTLLSLLWLGCALFSLGCAHDEVCQTILRSISGIMVVVAAADVMGRDKAECSISRVLSDRNPGCQDSNNYAFE